MDKILVFILFLIALLSETKFNILQQLLETVTILYLTYNILLTKISRNELYLISLFLFVSIGALFTNTVVGFLLNFKIFLLAILTLIYFKKKLVSLKIIEIIVFLNIFILLYQVIFNIYLLPTKNLGLKFEGLIDSRPLGLFFNTHMSAFVIACYFIYRSNKSKFYLHNFIGSILIFLFSSKFVLFAFIGNFISRFKLLFNSLIIFTVIIFFAIIFLISNDYLYLFPISGRFILQQLFDISSYKALINPFPQDYNNYLELQKISYKSDNIGDLSGNEIGNEIQLFTLYIEGGFLLASMYLYYFLKSIKSFRIFLFLSLIHYGFVTTPFIIFLIINFQNQIDLDSNETNRNLFRN